MVKLKDLLLISRCPSGIQWWVLFSEIGIGTIIFHHLLVMNNLTVCRRDSGTECILSKFASVTKQLIHWWEGLAARGAWQALEVMPCKPHEVQRGQVQKFSLTYHMILGERERSLHSVQCFKDKTIGEVPSSVWLVKEFGSWHTLVSQELFLAKPWGLYKA